MTIAGKPAPTLTEVYQLERDGFEVALAGAGMVHHKINTLRLKRSNPAVIRCDHGRVGMYQIDRPRLTEHIFSCADPLAFLCIEHGLGRLD
ncbi:hypothetical protein [Pseudomonas cedrina]|uniref:hypothetical protein n=1 Tax=Pseudomonas cedrina TaxID=651740 RepID=UPI00277FC894|nr:hypothetical protein [Pseudomonas cedrina]MDQ0653686.1 hypothetical protein [Pseudomonas cedrina]